MQKQRPTLADYLILREKIKTKTHKNESCKRHIRKFNQYYKIFKNPTVIQRLMADHLQFHVNNNDNNNSVS